MSKGKSNLLRATLITFFRAIVFLFIFDVIFRGEDLRTQFLIEFIEILFASLIVTALIWFGSTVLYKLRHGHLL